MLRSLAIILVLISSVVKAQKSSSYISIDQTIIAKDVSSSGVYNNGPAFGTSFGHFALNTFLTVYDDSKRSRIARESAIGKTEILKSNYATYDSFPALIVNGWHEAVATDHQNFCESVYVLINDNRIVEFVIDGCIRVNCSNTSAIKKARTMVTLKNFNGDKFEMVDVFFIYDMEGPKLVEEPMQAGYISIWSKSRNLTDAQIIMDRRNYGGVPKVFTQQPKPFEDGTFNMVLKPGTYTMFVKKSGNDKEYKFVIKSGQCLMYQL